MHRVQVLSQSERVTFRRSRHGPRQRLLTKQQLQPTRYKDTSTAQWFFVQHTFISTQITFLFVSSWSDYLCRLKAVFAKTHSCYEYPMQYFLFCVGTRIGADIIAIVIRLQNEKVTPTLFMNCTKVTFRFREAKTNKKCLNCVRAELKYRGENCAIMFTKNYIKYII